MFLNVSRFPTCKNRNAFFVQENLQLKVASHRKGHEDKIKVFYSDVAFYSTISACLAVNDAFFTEKLNNASQNYKAALYVS